MATPEDTGSWLFYLSLAAKCGGGDGDGDGQPHQFVGFAAVCAVAGLLTCLLHWWFPGGPAWGRWWWMRRRWGSGVGAAVVPPGPRGLPVIGSMWLMTGLSHRKLAKAAEAVRARRLMSFSLGETRVVVTAHPDVAREILSSASFADRPVKESAYGLLFHRAIGFAPHSTYWRALRRMASTHLFSPWQVAASAPQRAVIARQMVNAMKMQQQSGSSSASAAGVEVRRVLRRASLHNVMWSVFGRRYELQLDPGKESDETRELRTLVDEGYDLLGQLNWSDHLPWLARFDLQSTRARCSRLVPRVNRFVTRIIDEHRSTPPAAAVDFTDVLLSLQGSDKLADSDMIAVLWEMVFRGTDTVAVLIEWVLARLVLHQDVQARVHEELKRVVGLDRDVIESDLPSLVYLHAVIKEVLRLHPPGPLLSWARLAMSDVHVDGFLIPAGTTAMVNMWAITHDADVWAKPTEFRPERFVGKAEFNVMGSDLRLAPFGSGRRSCPGKSLAMATVAFWLATLLHEFTLLPSPNSARGVDLSEVLRLSCEMATPLTVAVQPRRVA